MSEAAFAVLLTALLAWAAHAVPRGVSSGPDLAAIDAHVEATMRADRVPGAALVIVNPERVVHLRGFGQDGRGGAVTPQTSFLLGSMSKSFTALAVMQLVEQGRVDLKAPVRRYLPWFRVADPEASEAITVAQALAHTTGIPTRAPRAGEPATLEDQVRALSRVHLSHPPGTRYEYASPNYLILGAIVERVSGQTYGDFLRRNVFTPLNMNRSFTSQDAAWRSGMSSGHRYWLGFPAPVLLPYEADRLPTAAIISSAGDLGHYLIAQLSGGRYAERRVLSAAGVAQMHRGTVAAPGENFRYAMGWREGPVRGVPAIHHGGILPHFRGKMVLLRETGWGVAVLTNVSSVLPLVPTSHRMADDIAASLVGVPLPGPSRLFQ
ncbi:serine hydrolase domain-containing protein [Deinococcus apachensis]|uniref:serine hydrolase domain-containing protein n=1 Tax=Deinococcus apachensis TaxID=309886 RepID=UPI0003772662|nr:serine hydrolase domain-containing protein [Deinococcus apachensis]